VASIRTRNGSYFVEIRKLGFRPIRRTFETKAAAKAFALQTEAAMDNGSWIDDQEQRTTFVGPLLEKYIEEIHPIKPFGKSKLATVKLTARAFQQTKISDLTPALILSYARGRKVSPHTLTQEFSYFAQAIDTARTLWNAPLKDNPVRATMRVMTQLGMIRGSRRRSRRLEPGELERLVRHARHHWIHPMILIAVQSAMRQQEIQQLTWEDVDFKNNTILIRDRKHPTEKIGNDQVIPMFPGVRAVLLKEYEVSKRRGPIFDVQHAASVSDRFARLCKKAKVEDLRFHDLRHEAISRMFEKGMTIPEVAAVSGHKTWTQLKRYTQLRPEEIMKSFKAGQRPSVSPPPQSETSTSSPA
jgi:integrase